MTFPNVPDVPGVPPLNRGPDFVPGLAPQFMRSDSVPANAGGPPVWGIFLNGQNVVTADTITSFEFRKESSLPDYPIQGGKLETYNKVQRPYDIRVRFASGADTANRTDLLTSIAAIADTLDLYDVVTPEQTYLNANVHYEGYHRTAQNGVGLLQVDISLQQIRVAADPQFVSTKTPAGAPVRNGGPVQTTTPTPEQLGVPAIVN